MAARSERSEAWQTAIREQRSHEIAQLLAEDPALCDELITFERQNGSTYRQHALIVSRRSLSITKLLVAAGADVDWRDADGGTTPMMGPSLEVARFLVGAGADVDAFGYEELTPLAYAVYERDHALVRDLIQQGAQIDRAHPAEGITPLHYAARRGDQAMIQLLLAAGADRSLKDAHGRTPADWAEAEQRTDDVLSLLHTA